MNNKNAMMWAVTLCSTLIGLASCKIDMPKDTPSSFETMTIEKTDITLPLKFSAKMKGQSDVTIMPQISGQLMQICVSEGQRVNKGDLLFVIDSRNAQLEVEAAQANLQAVEANLQAVEANLQSAQANLLATQAKANSAKLEYESTKNLFDRQIVSNYMLENSLNTYKQAQAAVSQAEAAVSQAKASVTQSRASVTQAESSVSHAKVNLGFCSITAPVTGIIGEIPVRIGVQVSPATQLTILSGNLTMDAEFSVNESIVESQISAGANASKKDEYIASLPDVIFMMKNGTEYPYRGRITSLTGVVDAHTGTLGAKASFPNPDGVLYSGIQGTVVIPLLEEGVIVVPQNAVVRLQDRSLVYKVNSDSTATAVTVKTESLSDAKNIAITEGLEVGDVIVTDGANNVQEGQRVIYPEPEQKEE